MFQKHIITLDCYVHNSWKIKTKKDDPGISRGQNKTLQLLRWIMLGCVSPHIIKEYLTYPIVQKITKKIRRGCCPGYDLFIRLNICSLFILPCYIRESHRSEAIDEILKVMLQSFLLKLRLCSLICRSVFTYSNDACESSCALCFSALLCHGIVSSQNSSVRSSDAY